MEPGLGFLFTPGWDVEFSELLLCFYVHMEVKERKGEREREGRGGEALMNLASTFKSFWYCSPIKVS